VAVPVLCLTFFLRVCMTVPGSAASLPVARDAGGRASEPRPPEPRERCSSLHCSV